MSELKSPDLASSSGLTGSSGQNILEGIFSPSKGKPWNFLRTKKQILTEYEKVLSNRIDFSNSRKKFPIF